MSVWRAPFEAALRMFATVSEALRAIGQPPPILVGGAAWRCRGSTGRASLINPELPRNARANRTDSNRALLVAIEHAGGRW